MSRAEIEARLSDLQKKYPNAFIEGEFKDVTRTGVEFLEHNEEEASEKLLRMEAGKQSLSRDA